MKIPHIITSLVFGAALLLGACGEDQADKDKQTVQKHNPDKELLGAGATFPYPLYNLMFRDYLQLQEVRVNYQAIGSGGGLRQIKNRTVDFGGTDAFLEDDKLAKFESKVLHIPIALGAVALTYNLPGAPELNLTGELISDIFMGKVTKWNDKKIRALNQKAKLPNSKITVVRRSDGSGTTAIFSEYLSKVSPDWKTKVGQGKSIRWPAGMGAKGNDGVTNVLKKTQGAISYVELAYALKNKLPVAKVQNSHGTFIEPGIESTSLASTNDVPPDSRISLTNPSSPEGYPIAGFTWILIYEEQNYSGRSLEKAKTLVDLVWWMTHDGQKHTKELLYAPLSPQAQGVAENILRTVKYKGQPLIQAK
jgi:phosphate transport system substrate-binding protein